jgi:type IV pilus assembly protein PilM
MALPFLGSGSKQRDQVVGIDLGAHSAKAVHLQRRGNQLVLAGFAVLERAAPASSGVAEETEVQRLGRLMTALGGRCKQVAMVVGAGEAIVRPAELPLVPLSDMRTMLKYNAKNYLQQDLSDCAFDCFILPPRAGAKAEALKPGQKARVLVGALKNKQLDDVLAIARGAGLTAEVVVPEPICPVNAFEMAQPEVFGKEAVALVDLGFRHSSICVLFEGELALNRVVGLGGDRLTTGLAEALGTSYGEAEGIKVGLAHEVESAMGPLLMPLARELRASIDFFEHQQDRTVGQVYVSGAASRSEYLLEALHGELGVPCASWNPVAGLGMGLPAVQLAGLEAATVLLSTAVGAAISAI